MHVSGRWIEGLWTEDYSRPWPGQHPYLKKAPGEFVPEYVEANWVGGNNYKGSGYYGAYPPDYLERVWTLFPDFAAGTGKQVLHAFSGSLRGPVTHGVRVDIRYQPVEADLHTRPSVQSDCRQLPFGDRTFDLVLADTPYGPEHAERYGTAMPDRRAVTKELARVTRPGGFLLWLDTKLPMFRKDLWHWCGLITVVRSTNHDFRVAGLFERTA